MWSLTEFNLIVVGSGRDNPIFAQERGSYSFPKDRMFQWTEDNFKNRYRGDIASLRNLPAIITAELYGRDIMPAFFGSISEVKEQGANISFRFQKLYDGISANEIFDCGLFDLYIRPAGTNRIDERFRIHWAIKEGNAVDVVFRLIKDKSEKGRPKIFNVPEWPIPIRDTVAVMMPFSQDLDVVHEAIKTACSIYRLEALRVDDISSPTPIADDVFKTIAESKLVICDLTGLNRNVLYETGLAHGLNRDVIMIVQDDDDTTGIPFDLRHIRYIKYKSDDEGIRKLTDEISNFIRDRLDAQ